MKTIAPFTALSINPARKLSRLISLLLAGLALSSPAWAGGYTFTELAPPSGAAQSFAMSINNSGQVVGYSDYSSYSIGCYDRSCTRATIWNNGVATLAPSSGTSGYAYAINDSGQTAGYGFYQYSSANRAYLWDGMTMTNLGGGSESRAYAINNLGQVAGISASNSYVADSAVVWNGVTGVTFLGKGAAYAINDVGQVAGYSYTPGTNNHATLWNGTTATDLGTLGGSISYALTINNIGQVAGYSQITGDYATHATLWNNTTMTDLGTLGGLQSVATDINDSSQIVGGASTAEGAFHAFLWDGTTMIDLNTFLDASTVSAGWVLKDATGINNQGWIIGSAFNTTTNITQPYLLAPASVPVPAAAWLLGSGLLGLIGVARRKAA